MKFYVVKINAKDGAIESCVEITQTQYDAAEPNPLVNFGTVVIPTQASNPKSAQRTASGIFTGIKDRLQSSY